MGGTPRGRGGGVATHARRERMGGMAPRGVAPMLLLLLLLLPVLLSRASFCTSGELLPAIHATGLDAEPAKADI